MKGVRCSRVLRTATSVCVLLLVLILLAHSVHNTLLASTDVEEVKKEFIEIYTNIADLGKQGVNVSLLVHELSRALKLINDGSNKSVSEAKTVLAHVRSEVESLKAKAPQIILMNNLRKYGTAAAIAAIPVAFYFLLPRIYLVIWFRVRKRWVVES